MSNCHEIANPFFLASKQLIHLERIKVLLISTNYLCLSSFNLKHRMIISYPEWENDIRVRRKQGVEERGARRERNRKGEVRNRS